jgi:hypothetical protein
MALDHYRHHHELHFRKVLLDWLQVKKGMKEEKKLGHSTKLFTDALRKANLNPDDIFNSELSKDPELRNWIESEVGDLDNLK